MKDEGSYTYDLEARGSLNALQVGVWSLFFLKIVGINMHPTNIAL